MLRSTLLIALVGVLSTTMNAQNTLPLYINDIEVTFQDRTFSGTPVELSLRRGRWTPIAMLAASGGVTIDARFKARKFRSRISAHKSTGIQMRIRYRCYYQGSKKKVKVTRNFFLNSDRSFEEKQRFVYSRGFMNTKIELKFTGKMPV